VHAGRVYMLNCFVMVYNHLWVNSWFYMVW